MKIGQFPNQRIIIEQHCPRCKITTTRKWSLQVWKRRTGGRFCVCGNGLSLTPKEA